MVRRSESDAGIGRTVMPSRAIDQRFLKPVLVLALDTATEVVVAAVFQTAAGPPPEAGAQAGKMRSRGQMWVLWPKGHTPPGGKPGA